jgi:hypothetical protein
MYKLIYGSISHHEVLLKLRNRIEKRMTPAQIAEAQRLARNWNPKDTK